MKSLLEQEQDPGPAQPGGRSAEAVDHRGPRKKSLSLLRLMRPRHWIKNVFVLAPLMFAQRTGDPTALISALVATALFCLAASSVYLINDLFDIQDDRRHALKIESRPLASGAVTPRAGAMLLAALLSALLIGSLFAPVVIPGLMLYLVINVAYSAHLKHVPVVDLFCIASGFVIRVWVGAVAIGVPLSSWMLITTLCLALYLAATKRRQELTSHGTDARFVLSRYSVRLLERYAEMSGIGAIVFYGLYITQIRPSLVLTLPLVLFGLFRYWYVLETHGAGESPTEVAWTDLPLILTVSAWALLVLLLMKGPPVAS